ncbi:DUF2971 domain-containing protein [Rheinheimera sp. MM224]|uniref:DUF2971 domain-containing protein n=1 Tax=Rheinheimera sp. MM224 TaxID=3019969 RepID=UPI0021F81537|nr:DUF2971 domain-containing protein [Rheinheimera sp. MM224]CAI3799072.1 hypothetical protein JAMGFMIE_02236 [Rheinheimera sp. MM224]
MILYKYYSFESGIKALESKLLGFRVPLYFNDPFELSWFDSIHPEYHYDRDLQLNIQSLKSQVVILSLSRSFSNPLMWAHYGSSHEGIVIGYDVSQSYLSSRERNIISVSSGDVIYRNSKPELKNFDLKVSSLETLIERSLGSNYANTVAKQVLFKDFFLTKHISWAYEEEVRVVKPLYPMLSAAPELYGAFKECNKINGLHYLNEEANIKEVYFGARCDLEDAMFGYSHRYPNIEFFRMYIDSQSWKLTAEAI